MIIRKMFKVESSHIVRNCSTARCKYNIHGHSYRIELLIKSSVLDKGHMIVDFGILKDSVKDVVDSFDHCHVMWDKDNIEYINDMKTWCRRYIILPVNPSAEQLSRVIFLLVDKILKNTIFLNGEMPELYSVIVHETDTGYAQCFKEDVFSNKGVSFIDIDDIEFSSSVIDDWNENTESMLLEDCKLQALVKPYIQVEE